MRFFLCSLLQSHDTHAGTHGVLDDLHASYSASFTTEYHGNVSNMNSLVGPITHLNQGHDILILL